MRVASRRSIGQLSPTQNYHRQLAEVAIIGIILGALFLLFLQNVSIVPVTASFTTDYCSSQLDSYVPNASVNAAFDVGLNGTLIDCSVAGTSASSLGFRWDGSYDCEGVTIRYALEEGSSLAVVMESEVPELVYSNETLVANLTGVPRFTYSVTIYNPATRTGFDGIKSKLNSHDCNV